MTIKLIEGGRGIAPTISTIMMIVIVVACMTLVIGFGLNFIDARNAQMGERLCVEKIFFTEDDINAYLRNIGHRDLTLRDAKVNGQLYPVVNGMNIPAEGRFVTIEGYEVNPEGVYAISFLTSRNNELGHTELEYMLEV
jgi:flagellin-like protein